MQDKFSALSKGAQVVIILVSWLLTVIAFVGDILIRNYYDALWLEIIATCVGMFFCVLAICVTIYKLSSIAENKTNENE